MNSPDLLRTSQWGADRKKWLDEQLGVGPWGKSMAPEAQQQRDFLELAQNDPQAYKRLQVQTVGNLRPNPFAAAAGGGGYGGSARGYDPTDKLTSFSSPGSSGGAPRLRAMRPVQPLDLAAGVMQPRANTTKKYPNPFS